MSLHLLRMSWIFATLSGTTALATTLAPPSLSDEELITETALGPLFICKGSAHFDTNTNVLKTQLSWLIEPIESWTRHVSGQIYLYYISKFNHGSTTNLTIWTNQIIT